MLEKDTHEIKARAANSIAQTLQKYLQLASVEGKYVVMNGLRDGELSLPREGRMFKLVSESGIGMEEMGMKIGLSEAEVSKGWLVLIEDRGIAMPGFTYGLRKTENIDLSYITIDGVNIKRRKYNEKTKEYEICPLSEDEQRAISMLSDVGTIPYRILEEFGSYDEFRQYTKAFQMPGIDSVNSEGHTIFNGGLSRHVDVLNRTRRGLPVGDSSAVMIGRTELSLSHFELIKASLENRPILGGGLGFGMGQNGALRHAPWMYISAKAD